MLRDHGVEQFVSSPNFALSSQCQRMIAHKVWLVGNKSARRCEQTSSRAPALEACLGEAEGGSWIIGGEFRCPAQQLQRLFHALFAAKRARLKD